MFDGVFCYPFYSILVIPNVIICDGESTANVMEGDLMTLHCFYDTNVTPVQIMWLQNNISISPGEGNGSTSIPLQIKRITRSKSRSYICTVWNDVGVGSDEVCVVVMCKLWVFIDGKVVPVRGYHWCIEKGPSYSVAGAFSTKVRRLVTLQEYKIQNSNGM